MAHSDKLRLNIIPSTITMNAAMKWILELCSYFRRDLIPFRANLKLPILDFNENLSDFMKCQDK
jgi:hypothetical protein